MHEESKRNLYGLIILAEIIVLLAILKYKFSLF
jgi:hypothetical protein